MWFVVHVVKEDANVTLSIPANCDIGEVNNPDFRVKGLDGGSMYTFLITAQNKFTKDLNKPDNISTILPGELSNIIDEQIEGNGTVLVLPVHEFNCTYRLW